MFYAWSLNNIENNVYEFNFITMTLERFPICSMMFLVDHFYEMIEMICYCYQRVVSK
jgi:hypothetical protein